MTIKFYTTMQEFYTALGGTMEQDFDCTVQRLEDVHAQVPLISPLFRTNYYTLVIIQQGRGRYLVDSSTYSTMARTIYFTNPGHIKGFEIHERNEGYLITFAESFLKQYVAHELWDTFPFLIAEVAPPQYPEQDVFDGFALLGEQLYGEYERSSPYKAQILGGLLRVLLFRIKETFWSHYDPLLEADSRSQIVLLFKHQLEDHFQALLAGEADHILTVQDYAEAQMLHPHYFSTVIKRKTGKSVQTWMIEKTIVHAQALLVRSQAPVQQIAYQLGFKEPNHFSRFFKKYTGMTPSAFRKTHA